MDYTMIRLIASMLSKYLKELDKSGLPRYEEELKDITETRDLFCQLVKTLDSGVMLGDQTSDLYELKNKCFTNLSKILFILWL